MKKLLLGILLMCSLSGFANTESVDVEKYSTKINSTFMQNCIDNSYSYEENTVACTVYKVPKGRRILTPGSFIARLSFIQVWSDSTCRLEGADQLYLKKVNGEIIFAASDSKCFEIMRNQLDESELSEENVSIYTIKE